MVKYGLMFVEEETMCCDTFMSEDDLKEHYKYSLTNYPGRYKIIKLLVDEEPPTPVVKDALSDRPVMFIPHGLERKPEFFDHIETAKQGIGKEGDLYQHIGRMECVFKPTEEM